MTERIDYQGPPKEYESYIDDTLRSRSSSTAAGTGYADIDFLLSELDLLKSASKQLYDSCVSEMKDFTVLLDASDSNLITAHQMSYPDDVTPDSISFAEYIYNFSVSQSTSSQYVNKYFENKIRGIYGTNSLDIAHITRIIHSETVRILEFLETYTGDIDDPSEFRVIEAFQNWAQDTKVILTAFEQIFQQKAITKIPEGEMAELDERKAKEFQSLFQSKLNIINGSISDIISQTYKDWDIPAGVFYNKILGPSLKFRLNVSNNIMSNLNSSKAPTLFQEASATSIGLSAQFQSALSDQVKRNRLFYEHMESLAENIIQRDTYIKYLDQLSNIGKVLPRPFISQIADENQVLDSELVPPTPVSYSANATSDHNLLTDRENLSAHPQYVLKNGDTIEGDLFLNGSLTLNGIKISELFYVKNGVAKMPAGVIDWDNLSNLDVVGAGSSYTPDNLHIVEQKVLLDNKVEYIISFDVDDITNLSYEIEIIEL